MGEETKEKIYSYSRLENYKTCPRSYYKNYIEKNRNEDNIYSFLGSTTHELLEELQRDNITNEEAIDKFENALIDADLQGLTWMSDSVRDKYVAAIKHYLVHYKKIECDEFFIEEYFEITVGKYKMKGFIDLYTITNGEIDIYDYKTSSSSSFTGKDAYKKMRQMILYGIAINHKYPDKKINTMNFDMLKYYKVPSKRSKLGYTLKDRSTIDILDFTTEFKPAYISTDFTQELVDEVINYVETTIDEIESLDENNVEDFPRGKNPRKDFFCSTLCSFCSDCKNEQ